MHNCQEVVQVWKEQLQHKGLLPSKQRLIIMQALSQQTEVEDLEALWLQLRHRHKVSWATFYSFIRLSVQEKWLLKEGDTNSEARFILTVGN